jgi:hypothetical protein
MRDALLQISECKHHFRVSSLTHHVGKASARGGLGRLAVIGIIGRLYLFVLCLLRLHLANSVVAKFSPAGPAHHQSRLFNALIREIS